MPFQVISQVFRNNEFLLWVKREFDTPSEQTAAIKAFTWIKNRYPEAVPHIRGEMVSEDKQEA